MMSQRTSGAVMVAALLLAGCGQQGGQGGAATTSAAPTPVRYASVTELKDAAVQVGYQCPNWQETNHVTVASGSGSCNDDDVFMLFSDEGQVPDTAAFLQSSGSTILSGPNWIINGARVGAIKDALGGTLGAPSGPSTSATTNSAYPELKPEDIKVGLKVTKKQCFGSAGCNVTYQIEPSSSAVLDPAGKWQITYSVKGLEDEQINTFTLDGDGTVHFAPETGTTTSSKSKLTAEVTDVSRTS